MSAGSRPRSLAPDTVLAAEAIGNRFKNMDLQCGKSPAKRNGRRRSRGGRAGQKALQASSRADPRSRLLRPRKRLAARGPKSLMKTSELGAGRRRRRPATSARRLFHVGRQRRKPAPAIFPAPASRRSKSGLRRRPRSFRRGSPRQHRLPSSFAVRWSRLPAAPRKLPAPLRKRSPSP